MASLSAFMRSCLNLQGYGALEDEAKARYQWALRFTSGVCTLLVLIGLIRQSPAWLWTLAAVTLVGALLPQGHPIDLAYNLGLRHLVGAPALPPNPAPRRFACFVGACFLIGSALAFQRGLMTLGWVLGGFLSLAGVVVTLTNWCFASWIYRVFFGRQTAASV